MHTYTCPRCPNSIQVPPGRESAFFVAHGWALDDRGVPHCSQRHRNETLDARRRDRGHNFVDGGSPSGRYALAHGSHTTPADGRTSTDHETTVSCARPGCTNRVTGATNRIAEVAHIHGWRVSTRDNRLYCSLTCIHNAPAPMPPVPPVTELADVTVRRRLEASRAADPAKVPPPATAKPKGGK